VTIAGEVRAECFGAEFQQQGRGYYVALELLAVARGVLELGGVVLAPDDDAPRLRRRSHDTARRLAAGASDELSSAVIDELGGADVADVLGRLFRSLTVPIPGRRTKTPPWQQLHLTPFVGQLVHWDAVIRRSRVSIEEYTYRGVGSYAYRLLRTDPDSERLKATRGALVALVSDAETPLSVLGRAARARDEAAPSEYTAAGEPDVGATLPDTPWVELLRSGTNAIVTRSLPREKRVELILHWVPYAMARHLLSLADIRIGTGPPRPLVLDFTGRPGPVRRLARRHFKDAATAIVDAMDRTASEKGIAQDEVESDRRKRWTAPRSFFTGTLAMIGGLNAPVGTQYLTLGLPLLEAVVAAMVPAPIQVEFAACSEDILGQDLGLIVDARSAARCGLLEFANASDFEVNAERLADRLRSLGLLHDFSDRTRMVGFGSET
jgi:hypothetical protein